MFGTRKSQNFTTRDISTINSMSLISKGIHPLMSTCSLIIAIITMTLLIVMFLFQNVAPQGVPATGGKADKKPAPAAAGVNPSASKTSQTPTHTQNAPSPTNAQGVSIQVHCRLSSTDRGQSSTCMCQTLVLWVLSAVW